MKAETIAKALGGRKIGNRWMGRCPAHNDRDPSLSIQETANGRVLVHLFAGCDQARVIAALRSCGLWENNGHRQSYIPRQQPRWSANHQPDTYDYKRAHALNIWQSSTAASGTLVETYLLSRGLTIPPPTSLRFHVALKHPQATCGPLWSRW